MTEITPIPGHPDLYSVSVGGGTYLVNAESGDCSCPHFAYRLVNAATPTMCKHGRALMEHLAAETRCSGCEGRGFVFPRLRYAAHDGGVDDEALTCLICDGSGKRPNAAALPSEAELRKVFA